MLKTRIDTANGNQVINVLDTEITVVGTVYKTKDYSLFSHVDGNRNIDPLNLSRLNRSLSKRNHNVPIIVNENHQVIDGQHRLEVCQRLNHYVHFLVMPGLNIQAVQDINSVNRIWSRDDYMDGFVKSGNLNYQLYKQFKGKYKFGHAECHRLLTGHACDKENSTIFRSGDLHISQSNYVKASKFADWILSTGEYYPGYKRRSYIRALIRADKCEGFSRRVFLKKLAYQSRKLIDQTTIEDYISIIEEIYNYRNTAKVKL
jgi:hypothetical protein